MINRLKALYDIQKLDDQLDELEELRGDLPASVSKVESELHSLSETNNNLEEEIKQAEDRILESLERSEKLAENQIRFKSQLHTVSNNREYDALTKQIDNVDAQLSNLEKEGEALKEVVIKNKKLVESNFPAIEELKAILHSKQKDLHEIIAANQKEESKIKKKRESILPKIKQNDYDSYTRLRKAKRGKAIATIKRGSCSGCHNMVPAQRQIEVRKNDRIFNCEFCGRILISAEIAEGNS